MKKKIQLTVETHELLVIKRAKNLTQTWCGECGGHVPLIRPEAAAVLARVSLRTVYRRVEAGRVHFAESPEGWLFICPRSLLDESRIESTPLHP